MRNLAPFIRREKAIAASDAGTIRQRWEYGRLLLVDPEWTTPAGNLRHGAIAELIEAARKAGEKLSEREIRYRLDVASAYPCDSQYRHARADIKTWTELREASSPAVDPEPGEEPFDPRTPLEKARAAEKQLAFGEPADPAQLLLFEYWPGDQFDQQATLAELAKHADDMAEWTARRARKDAERAAYLARLVSAVDGDMSKTWEQAQAALDATGGAAA